MAYGKEILSLQGVTKRYSGVTVLSGVDFRLHQGEIHCIVGENGAGKSTFIKILSGAIRPDGGEITLFGEKRSYTNPQTPIRLGVSTIYQDADLVDTLTVADNIFLGGELVTLGRIDRRAQEQRAAQLLEELGVRLDPALPVEQLTPAQKQLLQMVKALHRKAKILVMDEPTASLGEEESAALVQTVKRLASEGMGVIYISHYLEEVFQLAHTITVIKDGCVTGCYQADQVTNQQVISAMVGREASLFYQRERVEPGPVCLEVEHFTRLPAVEDVSFSLRRGEILGIGGLVGSGRTELMRLIYGVDRKQQGRLVKDGREIAVNSPRDAIRQGICMLSEDRKGEGMFLQRSITENICLVRNEKKCLVSPARDRLSAREVTQKLELKMSGLDQEVERLSGGNQQKSILARWLLTDCDVIIFDEPTKGVDIGAREELYKLMVELAKLGKAILMVSSDMPELLSMSDRIGVLREGRLAGILPPDELTEERLLKIYLGVSEGE